MGPTNSQVHEVVATMRGNVKKVLQHGLINTVGDVAKHDLKIVSRGQILGKGGTHGSADINSLLDARDVNGIVVSIRVDSSTIAKAISVKLTGNTSIVVVSGDSSTTSDGQTLGTLLDMLLGMVIAIEGSMSIATLEVEVGSAKVRHVGLNVQNASLTQVSNGDREGGRNDGDLH